MTYLTIKADMESVYEINKNNGWFDKDDRTFGDDIALLHSEIDEAFEAFVFYTTADVTSSSEGAKPEGLGSEFADCYIRLLDMCYRRSIPLAASGVKFESFEMSIINCSAFGGLHYFATAMLEDFRNSRDPELHANKFLSALVMATATAGLDLDYEFGRKCEYNATRGYRHGNKVI